MADAEYKDDAPTNEVTSNEYVSRTGQKEANNPVQADTDTVEDPIDPATADSDAQLGMHLVLFGCL